MLKNIFYVFAYCFFIISCSQQHKNANAKERYLKLLPLLDSAEAMGFKDKAATLLHVIQFTQPDTSLPNFNGKTEKQILPQWEEERDSAYTSKYNELAELQKEYGCFKKGHLFLIDTANKYVMAYICKDENVQLLVVLNMDEDNHALEYQANYPKADIVFCNYDIVAPGPVISSLALRPYEARVLKLHEF